MAELQSYTVGAWKNGSGDKVELKNPSSGQGIDTVAKNAPLDGALAFARSKGCASLGELSFEQRGAILKSLSKALHQKRDELIECSIATCGTTRSDAKFDLDGASATLAYYAGVGAKLGTQKIFVETSEQLGQSARFFGTHIWSSKRGVAVHINAFNFPAWGMCEKLAVSLLAGVPAISKPATSTAALAEKVARVMVDANVFPEGSFQLALGSLGSLLDELGGQDVIAFTGSADTGAKLRASRSVLERGTKINIEADSLNTAVLAPGEAPGTEPYRAFIRDTAREMTQKSGQKCTATRRIFVATEHVDAVASALAEELARTKIGDPANEDVRMGPLATEQQLQDYQRGIEILLASGAKPVAIDRHAFLGVDEGKGYFVRPALLRHDAPTKAEAVHAHEVFGPCATIMPYANTSELLECVAMGQGSLVVTVYGDDKAALETIALGVAAYHGRVLLISSKIVDQAISPGLVLPSCIHGGPGRAGGGEELGGERGLRFYMQRTAMQGDRAILDKVFSGATTVA